MKRQLSSDVSSWFAPQTGSTPFSNPNSSLFDVRKDSSSSGIESLDSVISQVQEWKWQHLRGSEGWRDTSRNLSSSGLKPKDQSSVRRMFDITSSTQDSTDVDATFLSLSDKENRRNIANQGRAEPSSYYKVQTSAKDSAINREDILFHLHAHVPGSLTLLHIKSLEAENNQIRSRYTDVNAKNSVLQIQSHNNEQKLKRLQEQLTMLKSQITKNQEEFVRAQKTEVEAGAREQSLNSIITTQKTQLEEFAAVIQRLSQDKAKLTSAFEDRQQRYTDLRSKHEQLKIKTKELEGRCQQTDNSQKLLSGMKVLKDSIRMKDQFCVNLENEKRQLVGENERLLEELAASQKKISQHDANLTSIQTREAQRDQALTELTLENGSMTERITYLERELNDQRATNAEADKLIESYKQNIENFQHEICEKDEYLSKLELSLQQNTPLKPVIDCTPEEFAELIDSLSYHQQELEAAKSVIDHYTSVIQKQQSELKELKLQAKAFSFIDQSELSDVRVGELEQSLTQHYEEIERLVAEIGKRDEEIHSLRNQTMRPSAEVKTLREKISALEANNGQLTRDLQTLKRRNEESEDDGAITKEARACLQDVRSLQQLISSLDHNMSMSESTSARRPDIEASTSVECLSQLRGEVRQLHNVLTEKCAEGMGQDCNVQ
ncbi:viral A-type inclusion protein [Planoprotostelium fungivorum]|uniref:Viral A-type inclusion protein n=1 Tax=Planoprotostelium fungivorum TaxID=1890364 RepID=A0A2P6NR83_9EUKA|nr:viral A-type inclusion protein [Planoprotostelium fungivorum]